MYKLVIADDEGKTTVVPLVRDGITIGRKEGNTIRLTERNVSRRHARLIKSNGAFVLEDLKSYNGVKVNGKRIDAAFTLKAGDKITIGDYSLALQLDVPESTTAPERPAATAVQDVPTAMIEAPSAEPAPPPRLVMLSAPAPGAEFALARPKVRIGRAEDLDIWVNHRSISRAHAEITRIDGGHRVKDLGSANGLRVNGKDTVEALLKPGDIVELGQVRFRFVGEGEVYAFETDRTVQMDSIPRDAPRAGSPWVKAGVILAVAGVVTAVVVLTGRPPPDAPPPEIEPDPGGEGPGVGATPSADPGPTTGATDAAFDEALRSCQAALEARRYGEAAPFGAAALRLRPGDASARGCRDAAEQLATEERAFAEGQRAVAQGNVDAAYMAFGELSAASPFRSDPAVAQATRDYAELHLRLARAALARSPGDAVEHAERVLTVAGLSAVERQEAETLARRGQQAMSRVAAGPRTGPGTTPRGGQSGSTPREEDAGASAAPAGGQAGGARSADDVSRDCIAQGGDFSRCVVAALRGRATGCRERAMLVESYKQLRDQDGMLREMEAFVRRCATHANTQGYRQILARYGRL